MRSARKFAWVLPIILIANANGPLAFSQPAETGGDTQSHTRPNVIVLLTDDLGCGDLGCYGGPVRTPNLDMLAELGVKMTDFHSGAAVCSPSRAALMTGRQHLRTGVYTVLQDQMHKGHLLSREVTIAEVLKEAGYHTAHFGKWHMGMSSRNQTKPSPTDHGFEYWFGLPNGAHPSHKDPVNFIRNGKPVGPMKGYSCQILIDDAMSWLDSQTDSQQPFFLNIWFNEPHSVIAAPDEIVSQYGDLNDPAAIYSGTIENTDRAIGRLVEKLKARGDLDNTIIVFSSDHGSYRPDRNQGLRGEKGSNFEGGLRSPGIFFWPNGIAGGQVESEPTGAVDLLPTICGLVEIDKPDGVHLDGADLSRLLTKGERLQREQPLFWLLPTSWPAATLRDGKYSLMAYRDYELPQDREAMNAILKRIGEIVSVDEDDGAGHLRNRVFNGTFAEPEANRLRSLYVRLNTFQESWVPIIKAGGFRKFELYDLATDPQQQHDIADEQPEVTTRLKRQLLALQESVMQDAPDWLSPEEIEAEKKARKELSRSITQSVTPRPQGFWERIDARPLPEGYAGARHQEFVDRLTAKMSAKHRARLSQLWNEKQKLDPGMPNRGFSFVRVLMFVFEGEKGDRQDTKPDKAWFRRSEHDAQPVVKTISRGDDQLSPGRPTLLSPHSDPLALHGGHLFVVNTPNDTLDVIDTRSQRFIASIPVGIDPVCVKVRPDGKEVWVSNHVSDSVSVIDNVQQSPTYLHVIATIQDIDLRKKSTRFDEPVGIAFANNNKAYVALSSTNQLAVIDIPSRQVVGHMPVTAQEPRSLRVRGDRLYVIPFESNNQTQLSGGDENDIDGHQVTFDARKLADSFDSAGFVVDIVKHEDIPDRDLYIFDTSNDTLLDTIPSLGTLQYGFDVDSNGNVLIAHTEARNHVNGRAGTKKHGLKELDNRPYLNRIARISATGRKEFIPLNPLPPQQPDRDSAIATPSAVHVAGSVIYVTAAGSDHLVTLDANSGARVKVGAVPRGVVVESPADIPPTAWVFNAVDNSVSAVDVSSPKDLVVTASVSLDDPTPARDKAGLAAFHAARASSNGTYSCASCHPDGHTDQLLWVLDTPYIVGADQIEPRLSQTLRGLRGTAPYHWDGIPGDPYGGSNASTREQLPPNCDIERPASAVRHLIDGGMATTMLEHGSETVNDEGKRGYLTATERDAMAEFLLNLSHLPTRGRAYTDQLSDDALTGFERFHITGARDPKNLNTMVCGSCHTFPYLTTDQDSMNVPSFRGALDRFITQAQARNSVISLGGVKQIAEKGWPEEEVWKRMVSMGEPRRLWPVIDMFKESSAGFSGAFGRQLTLSKQTANDPLTADLLPALETAAMQGTVVLKASGVMLEPGAQAVRVDLTYDSRAERFVRGDSTGESYSRDQLIKLAASSESVMTFTACHPNDVISAPPAIWTAGSLHKQRSVQLFPRINADRRTMTIGGRHVHDGAVLLVNGRRVHGTIRPAGEDLIEVRLDELPDRGLNMLQVQNPNSYLSNDFIFFVETRAEAIERYRREPDYLITAVLNSAIVNDNSEEAHIALEAGAELNRPHEHFEFERPPLILAAMYGREDLVDELLDGGADPNIKDRNGITALHEAARMCRLDICRSLLAAGAISDVADNNDNRPADLTSRFVDSGNFERYFARHRVNLALDHERYRKERPAVQKLLLQ